MSKRSIDISELREGVFTDGDRLFTINLAPGRRVYGERLISEGGIEYREWRPQRSKLAAYLKLGGNSFPINARSNVLYLGAASGTTPSHISDIVTDGAVYCVEFSPRTFRDLVRVCEHRDNMFPILANAMQPSSYEFGIEEVDTVYQDIAQRDQVAIFSKNMERFSASQGFLALKSRSEDVSRNPKKVYRDNKRKLAERGFRVLEMMELDSYAKDHAMFVVGYD